LHSEIIREEEVDRELKSLLITVGRVSRCISVQRETTISEGGFGSIDKRPGMVIRSTEERTSDGSADRYACQLVLQIFFFAYGKRVGEMIGAHPLAFSSDDEDVHVGRYLPRGKQAVGKIERAEVTVTSFQNVKAPMWLDSKVKAIISRLGRFYQSSRDGTTDNVRNLVRMFFERLEGRINVVENVLEVISTAYGTKSREV